MQNYLICRQKAIGDDQCVCVTGELKSGGCQL